MNIARTLFHRITIVFLGLSLCVVLAGCSDKGVMLRIGETAPAFSLQDIHGRTIRVPEDVKGRIVAIRFWASWCKSCAAEMPQIEGVYKNYSGKGLQILAVNIGQDKSEAEKFAREHNISYPLLPDPGKEVTEQYGVKSIPMTFILDGSGIIRKKILGEISTQNFEKIVDQLMEEKKS